MLHSNTANQASQAQEDGFDRTLPLSRHQIVILLVSVMVVAISGIAYELIIAAVSSYLVGNGVLQFSLTIGLFMLAMGIGSLISQRIHGDLVTWFIGIEILLSVLGGWSSSILFWAFPGYTLYRPVSWALILSIGTLVGLEIPLLTRILSRASTWRAAIANVLSLDYFGALIGSVAFPLFLLPTLGLFQSSLGVALLNAIVAIITLVPFRRQLKHSGKLWVAAISAVLLLTAGLAGSNWLQDRAEAQLFTAEIMFRKQTPYQRIIFTRDSRNGNIRLYLDGHLQFAQQDEHRYHEALVHPVMSMSAGGIAKDEGLRVLVLGGGDGLAVRELFKFPRVTQIDLVDIDPAMTNLAKTLAPLRKLNEDAFFDERVKIHHADAFSFVQSHYGQAQPKWGRVIIDLPDPHDEALSKLYSVEFYKLLAGCMDEGGMLVCQSSSPFFTPHAFWCVAATMEAAGLQTQSYTVPLASFGPWGFHIAAKDHAVPPQTQIDDSQTKFLTTERFAVAKTFGKDESRVPTRPNTLFEPTIYLYYLNDLNR
ncbi:MAG: polyamine aminopropyltransferase [Pirellulaceae bacterium]